MMPRLPGRLSLILRLASRDLRRRRAEALLMLIVVTAATGTLTLGLVLTGVTSNPYQHTRAVTAGPDVVANSAGAAPGGGPPASLVALEHAPGVTGFSGPYLRLGPVLRVGGRTVPTGFNAVGRSQAPAAIDQPKVTEGSWVRPGGIVIEPTYAAEADLAVGDRVTLSGRPFLVVGLAVTAAYPSVNAPGLIWLTEADARGLISRSDPASYVLNLKLADPASATAFADVRSTNDVFLESWQQIASHDARQLQIEQATLGVGSWLLGMLAIASVAVLAGGRMAEQARRVGLLKAVGGSPGLVAAVLLAEHLTVALAAAVAGLGVGWLAAPLLTSPADGLIGAPGAPALTAATAGIVVLAALAVALLSTFFPAIRAARTSTVAALSDGTRAPRRSPRLIALSRRLPVPLLLGLRLAGRRPRRLVFSAASVAITVATMVGVLNMLAQERVRRVPGGLVNPVHTAASHVLIVITIVLVVLTAVNAIFVTSATVRDSRRPLAVARSLGASPEQVSAGVSAAQLTSALPGALLGVPFGILLIAATSRGSSSIVPSAWGLLGVVLIALAGIAALTAGPARAGARQPAAEILREEP
jgi:ABC-type lipoprotein release transport system permease subunit